MIVLIKEEYSNENLDNPAVLCDLINTKFNKSFTESDIRDYYICKQYENDRKLIEAEDAFLIYKHLYSV